ncbi:hypothetical protein [Peribacillus frigoritolerans]|nr:hypothetical protein [Peribacillus frigoritolerans]
MILFKNDLNQLIAENPFIKYIGVQLVKFEEGEVVMEHKWRLI